MIAIERLSAVDDRLAEPLAGLFDEGVAWDAEQGMAFLADPENLFLLARWDGTPCGFLTAHRLQRFDRRRAEVLLYEIGVDEHYQRRGVARALIAELKCWSSEVGADEMWVLTNPSNIPAMALYTATGGALDPEPVAMFSYPVAAPVSGDDE